MPLPAPDPAFRWTTEAWGPVLRCVALETIAQHAFTSRQPRLPTGSGGAGARAAGPRVLRPGAAGAGPEGWAIAARAVGANADRVMRVKQVHGRDVRVLGR